MTVIVIPSMICLNRRWADNLRFLRTILSPHVLVMKKLILASLLLFAITPLSLAGLDAGASQLLVSAERQVDLFSHDASPFLLKVDYSAQVNMPLQGHLTWAWESKERWWRLVTLGDFQQIDVRNGEKLYSRRNSKFTPLRVQQLFSMLEVSERLNGVRVKKEKSQVDQGQAVRCLEISGERKWDHEICVNADSHEVVVNEWKQEPEGKIREEYSEYAEFRGVRYPRKIERTEHGLSAITAQVASLTTAPIDEGRLVAPKGSVERRKCANMKPPLAVKTPDPKYPTTARENRLSGKTTVSMTVLADGSVVDVQLIGSAGQSLDQTTLQTLESWKFKPAMCGADPVVSDIQIEINFHLQ